MIRSPHIDPNLVDTVLRRFDDDISADQLLDWLGQFDPDERVAILTLTSHFSYFSSKSTGTLLESLYSKVVAHIGPNSFDIQKTWFVPVGYVAKSGSLIAYLFRKNADVPLSRFVNLPDLDTIDIKPDDCIVFLDDFLGSGAQAIDVWRHTSERIQISEQRFILAILIAQERGIDVVIDNTRLEVVTNHVLTDMDALFSPLSRIFATPEDREYARSVVSKYGLRLYPEHPHGYNESQCLVGFFYSTPNNTLPIYWALR